MTFYETKLDENMRFGLQGTAYDGLHHHTLLTAGHDWRIEMRTGAKWKGIKDGLQNTWF